MFLNDYSTFVIKVVDHIWRFGYKDFSIRENSLNISKFIDYKDFDFIKTDLSARAKNSAVNQASQIIRSCVEKQRRVLWVKKNKNNNVKDKKIGKPNIKLVKPNLSSTCCNWKESNNGKFYGFLEIKSIGKKYGRIRIPISHSREIHGKLKNGFIFSEDCVQFCWEEKNTPAKKGEKILAIDQGMNSVATCSDGQITSQVDNHNHSLSSILDKISRKKRGSKSFKRSQQHRKNFIGWSINQINFHGVKEVRLEKVVNIRLGKKSSKKMSHWSNPEIRDKIKRRCEKLEVPVIEQSCFYRSQRCNKCGNVRKANRKGKNYSCKNCGYCNDADYNAALNHLVDLPPIPKAFLVRRLNLSDGFFWKLEGFFAFDGSELRVPNSNS